MNDLPYQAVPAPPDPPELSSAGTWTGWLSGITGQLMAYPTSRCNKFRRPVIDSKRPMQRSFKPEWRTSCWRDRSMRSHSGTRSTVLCRMRRTTSARWSVFDGRPAIRWILACTSILGRGWTLNLHERQGMGTVAVLLRR